jgi:hypothetical protein
VQLLPEESSRSQSGVVRQCSQTFPFEDITARATIDLARLDQDIREDLASALPLLGKMPAPGSVEENAAFNKAQLDIATREAAEAAKRKAVEDSGHAQLALYQKAGLVDNRRNADLISDHISKNSGVFCAATVHAAVEGCKANLNWEPVAPPAAPQPAAQPVELLPNREHRLPLGTTPARHHSIAQLRDLDARQRASRSRHAGTFGARF